MTYDQIAGTLGFRDRSGVRRAVQRALTATVQEPADELRTLELERLDDLTRHLQRVLVSAHYAVTASGKVALHPETGKPLTDHGPVVQAALTLLRVSESRRKLLGLDAPAKARIEILDDDVARVLVDQMEEEIAALAAEQDGTPPR